MLGLEHGRGFLWYTVDFTGRKKCSSKCKIHSCVNCSGNEAQGLGEPCKRSCPKEIGRKAPKGYRVRVRSVLQKNLI